jgi:UDP-N-acetylglucosamine--N-acetylmuramyl-(pentapeptide) pyrophosphoryl-undecaprenol N-acetylglucosamine transferase
MNEPQRLLLTGGGTAGHVNPALAIGWAVAGPSTRMLFVGVRGRAESEVVPREGIPLQFVRASSYPGGRPSMALVRFVLNLAVGFCQACRIVLKFRPTVVVGTGGFAAAPVMFAAAALRSLGLSHARLYVHEQNAEPGKLNQKVGRLADRVFVTFPETLRRFPGNGVLTGYPLRRRIGPVDREQARARLDFQVPAGRQVVFVFGGSQGARTINRTVVDALRYLLPLKDRLFVVHGTGLFKGGAYDASADTNARLESSYTEAERREIATFYISRPFFHQIENVYAISDLVVARGGAGSLYEIASLGKPAIVIPKSNLPGDHQVMNARAMARCGGAVVIYEGVSLVDGQVVERVDGRALADTITKLLSDPAELAAMAQRSRAFSQNDALHIIERWIKGREAVGGAEAPPYVPPARRPPLQGRRVSAAEVAEAADIEPLPSNPVLLGRLERALSERGAAYRPEDVVTAPGDRAYLVSRAALLLASESWERRNLGVKLLGLLKARDQEPLLLALLADKRPAPFFKRMLGGDYVQVGFIRRNLITAFGRIGDPSPEVESALLSAFEDPYYEVRAEAARVSARLAGGFRNRDALVTGLKGLLPDRWLEVATAAARALGEVGSERDALPALLALKDARFWHVRAAALEGLLSLVARGEGGDPDALVAGLNGFILTSTDFKPEFEIKHLYGRLMKAVAAREGGER